MVVKHLETYVESIVPGLTYSSNLKKIIEKELSSRINSFTKPTLIFDASYAFNVFAHKNDLSFISIGELQDFKTQIEDFVEKIISYGVNFLVILRGNSRRSLKEWAFKEHNILNETIQLLNILKEKGVIDLTLCEHRKLLSYFECANNTFASISNKNYKVIQSLKTTHEEVAEIAKTQKCFAVIGQDSNYLIYDSIPMVISAKSLDVQTMDCIVYDKNKLLEHLQLNSYHLPLFASLSGNEVIEEFKLRSFHQKISKTKNDKFLAIAKIVSHTSINPYAHVKEISKLIGINYLSEELLSQSLDMYLQKSKPALQCNVPHILLIAEQKKKSCEISRCLYNILLFKEYKIDNDLENLSDPNIVSWITVLKPLRQKIYGIIFHEDKYVVINEMYVKLKIVPETPKPIAVLATKVECDHPGLISLWTVRSESMNKIRWNLFCTTVFKNINQYIVRHIPPKLLFPVAALHYLAVEVPKMTPFEVFNEKFEINAFLVVALKMFANFETKNFKIVLPDYKAIHLSTKFLRCCFLLKILNEVCGFVITAQESCICNFFDGLLFHYVYKKLKEGANCDEFFEENTVLKVIFYTLIEIIYYDYK